VDGITGEEDQRRDEAEAIKAAMRTQVDALIGGNLPTTAFVAAVKVAYRVGRAAYRAGREDLLRSGSCPECTAGDPHNEPDVPHIHLTPYGYLLYAADHERPGFIEEIRAVERRAGREDAARELGITCQDDPGALWPPADHFHECARERGHRSRTHRCQCGMEWQLVDQSGDGVQPTEEQRAHE
jgi:hypothetical protein